jgi:hypothetical protein
VFQQISQWQVTTSAPSPVPSRHRFNQRRFSSTFASGSEESTASVDFNHATTGSLWSRQSTVSIMSEIVASVISLGVHREILKLNPREPNRLSSRNNRCDSPCRWKLCKFKLVHGSKSEITAHAKRWAVCYVTCYIPQYRSSAKAKRDRRLNTGKKLKRHQNSQSGQNQAKELKTRWLLNDVVAGECENSLGFEYWLEESDDFFDIDVFKIDWLNEARLILTAS